FDTLADWLAWQDDLHPRRIDLGLERVAAVAQRLAILPPACCVVSVAGTNGKGSSVALLEACYRSAGYCTGAYTSPHLLRYNERVRIAGREASDAELCAAFEQIDQARAGISLTYFEFGTLAALLLFDAARPDILLLEVGMGGRLDAVNLVDADVALVTSIGIDHSTWLGNDREVIGREKAGILRAGRPVVCADPAPPASLREVAQDVGAPWYALGEHFTHQSAALGWDWAGWRNTCTGLPLPALTGACQRNNAAGALAVLDLLADRLPVDRAAIDTGLRSVRLPGRFQVLPGVPPVILDVAHNPDSAGALADQLQAAPPAGRTWLVLGMLADKDAGAFASALDDSVEHWCLAGLGGQRGLTSDALAQRIAVPGRQRDIRLFDSVAAALAHAKAHAAPADRIVVSGSFLTVAEALARLQPAPASR
ncbi:MAG: bifunctional tetrahydrofolate synthase/dihydrofolate synthase, partial [Gammaproteobacteria bacterium]